MHMMNCITESHRQSRITNSILNQQNTGVIVIVAREYEHTLNRGIIY